jgi:hypothetical protein
VPKDPATSADAECGVFAYAQPERRRPITDADVTDAIDWIERIALAIATVLG